ncbi:hypothetical protein BJ165DRAFT_1303891, partial [Panaeolus papilionaceus]
PLPSPLQSVLSNPIASSKINDFPHYFPIVMPVKIAAFRAELIVHPNLAFNSSIQTSLVSGFWPLVEHFPPYFPITHDESTPTLQDPAKAAFLREQRDIELAKNWYSQGLPLLLPGMYCMPTHAVPKDNREVLRLVTDYSCGTYSLNSLINRDSMPKAPLDNMK